MTEISDIMEECILAYYATSYDELQVYFSELNFEQFPESFTGTI